MRMQAWPGHASASFAPLDTASSSRALASSKALVCLSKSLERAADVISGTMPASKRAGHDFESVICLWTDAKRARASCAGVFSAGCLPPKLLLLLLLPSCLLSL